MLARPGGGDGPKARRGRIRVGGVKGPKFGGGELKGIVSASSEFIRQGWSIGLAGYKAELSSLGRLLHLKNDVSGGIP